jgi:2-amino-4-hydroxy-6-hydroxymethyldihydropteridine diphosphokinase
LVVSTVYQTRSVGFEGEDFYNLVAGFDTAEDVHAVAAALHEIEAAHGRSRSGGKFASRTLDIDLLLYDDLVLNENGLQLPRGEITRYAFVLGPLAEIAGGRRHPVLGKSFAELWAAFATDKSDLRPVQLA